MPNKTVIEIEGRKIAFISKLADQEEIDLNSLLRIDVVNIALEIITFPLALHEVGMLLAEANYRVNAAKMAMEIEEAKAAERIRDAHINDNGKALSNERTAEKVTQDPDCKAKRTFYYSRMKHHEIINSLYWAMKSKDDKLAKMGMSLQAGDIEASILSAKLKSFNYVSIKFVRE